MRNLFIEGIQGMGKSTLFQSIYTAIPELHPCREGDLSPVDLAWCAWMTGEEYAGILNRYETIRSEIIKNTVQEGGHFIVSYTRILTDIPDFHRELEKFEIYNGRKSLEDFEKIIFTRYENFSGTGYLFECSFFQNIIEDLILYHQLDDNEILDFYRRLYDRTDKKNFFLLYLYSEAPEEIIQEIKSRRCDEQGEEIWYSLMMKYLISSPHGKKHGFRGFEDMISHFRHRQQVELRIIREILAGNAAVLPARKWDIKDVLAATFSPYCLGR